MKKVEIQASFAIGYRCNSVQFLRRYQMSKFSGPFDWMYIDLQSAVDNITSEFNDYLSNIVIVNGKEKAPTPLGRATVNGDILDFSKTQMVYMAHDYKNTKLPINQNWTTPTSNDIYKWDRICVFLHHHLEEESEVEKIKIRIDRFLDLIKNSPDKVLFLYISKILGGNIELEIEKQIQLFRKLDGVNIVSILCSSETNSFHKKIDNVLFIVKNVPSYDAQYHSTGNDNDLEWSQWGMKGINFDFEFAIICNYFSFNLIDKEDI